MPKRGRGRGRGTTGQPVQKPATTDATQSASSYPHDFRTRSRSRSGSVESRVSQVSHASQARPKTGEDKRDKQDFKLTEEEEELMVTFLEENECIWNKKSMDYRKPGLKTTKWETQAKVMGKSTEHIQGWFKSMRDNYVRPRSKMPQSDGKLKTRFEGLCIVCLLLADPRAHSG